MWWRRRSWLSAQPAGTLSALGTVAHCSSTRGDLHNRHNTSTSDTAQHNVPCTPDTALFYIWRSSTRHNIPLHLTQLSTRCPTQQTSTADTAQHEVTCTLDTTLLHLTQLNTRWPVHETQHFCIWHSSTPGALHTRHNTLLHQTTTWLAVACSTFNTGTFKHTHNLSQYCFYT